jgi:iron only hydrogenase large subunit-like protein
LLLYSPLATQPVRLATKKDEGRKGAQKSVRRSALRKNAASLVFFSLSFFRFRIHKRSSSSVQSVFIFSVSFLLCSGFIGRSIAIYPLESLFGDKGAKNYETMSSVFLSNVDDYLGPSQACVNPLFSNTNSTTTTTTPNTQEGAVRTRKRRTVRERSDTTNTTNTPTTNAVVSASIADCLACSGCVTTAETVLLEEKHSIEKLRQWIHQRLQTDVRKRFVVTLSPSSWADLMRHMNLQNSNLRTRQQQLTTFFHQYWAVDVVMDANVPLEWSRLAAAKSFVDAYRQSHEGTLPQLASSCPATVCLIEKSIHAAVPHLSPIPSPMSCAGAYFKQQDAECFHLAVMPCHDKKLEASRTEFTNDMEEPLVDMSITTTECWQLMQEVCRRENATAPQHITELVEQLPVSAVYTSVQEWSAARRPSCLIAPKECRSVKRDSTIAPNSTFFAESSGGYADFLFRYAARELFQTEVHDSSNLWQPFMEHDETKQSVVSARIASQKRRREFLHATLHYHPSTGTCSTAPTSESRPVLRFAIANGMQTIQKALKPFQENALPPFDYMEIMACPSGCINGGGQIRTALRETPTETRERIWTSQSYFQAPSSVVPTEIPLPSDQLRTQYRIIPPMQHTMGTVAGIEMKDAIW